MSHPEIFILGDRFESVTDRYLAELKDVAAGLVPKDSDYKYEHIVKGLRHIQIKVCRLYSGSDRPITYYDLRSIRQSALRKAQNSWSRCQSHLTTLTELV